MPLWDAVAGLPVRVDGYALERRELQTASGPRPGLPQSPLPAPEGVGF